MFKSNRTLGTWAVLLLAASVCWGSATGALFTIHVKNTAPIPLKDLFLNLRGESALLIMADKMGDSFSITRDGKPIDFQKVDENGDGKTDGIILVQDFGPNEAVDFKVEKATGPMPVWPKRTAAVLSAKVGGEWYWGFEGGKHKWMNRGGEWKDFTKYNVDPRHTDHSWDIRLEGPAWESDKAGYRLYLDPRSGMDLFGKKTDKMVLQNVGLDGFDSYHHMSDWGMDILHVGDSLGVGSVGFWNGKIADRVQYTKSLSSQILYNGDLYTALSEHIEGWRTSQTLTNIALTVSIAAGSRISHNQISIDSDMPNICTGIMKEKGVKLFDPPQPAAGGWTYLATYGPQSLAEDMQQHLIPDGMGLAVFYRGKDLIERAEDKLNHVVVLKPVNHKVDYYFGATWVQEPNGVKTPEEFEKWLKDTALRLNSPPQITYGSE